MRKCTVDDDSIKHQRIIWGPAHTGFGTRGGGSQKLGRTFFGVVAEVREAGVDAEPRSDDGVAGGGRVAATSVVVVVVRQNARRPGALDTRADVVVLATHTRTHTPTHIDHTHTQTTHQADTIITIYHIPSRYVTSQLGQLSLASLRGRLIEYQHRLGQGRECHLCRVAGNAV